MKSSKLRLPQAEVRWEETGEGMSVIFVHGIPTSPALWREVIPLVRRARCLAFEMVGYGQSMAAGRGLDISVGKQAEYLLAWCDALNIRRAILVGHDLGGGVVHIAAIRRRELVAGLLLTNAIGYDSWPIPSVKMMRAVGGLVRHFPAGAVKALVTPMFVRGHDDRNTARDSQNRHWRHYENHGAGDALIRQIRSLDVNDTLQVAEQIPKLRGIPARVIWGAADAFQKIEYGERFARDLGVSLGRIAGGKHFTPEDHPEIIARGVNELIGAMR